MFDDPIIEGIGTAARIDSIPYKNFKEVAPVRFYVVGASNDSATESYAGNYWFESDTFPIVNGINWHNLYLHKFQSERSTYWSF